MTPAPVAPAPPAVTAEKPASPPPAAPTPANLASAPAPTPALSAPTVPTPAASAAPVAVAAKDPSLATTVASNLKQGAVDTLQRTVTDAQARLLAPTTGSGTVSATTVAANLKQGALDTLQRTAADAQARLLPPTATAPVVAPPATVAAGPAGTPPATGLSLADLSTDQVTRGLKEALGKGLQKAVSSLGQTGGFMTNLNVKIPMPEKLQTLEKTLRTLHQDALADDFVATMNQAAEQAVPAAADVFTGSLSKMTVDDAKKILCGPKDAATQYFRHANEAELKQRFLPIVQKATAKTGATAAYKSVLDRAKFASPFLSTATVDVDSYVTDKALDGLFKMVADEEKQIRENPVARTTDLLKSVFGSLAR